MESMLTFLSSCLQSVDLTTVTKADMRTMYLKAKGLSQLSKEDKKLFSVAVKTALADLQNTGNEISVEPDSKEEDVNTAVEDSCGEAEEKQLDSDDDFSPEEENKISFPDKKKAGRKILSDSEMSAEEDENGDLENVINQEIIAKTNKIQNDHVFDDEQDSNGSSVGIVQSEDNENRKDKISNLSNKKGSYKISDDESSQDVPFNGNKKRLHISSSSENDNNSSQDDDSSSTKPTTPKRKKIKLTNNNSEKFSQEKKSNSAQKKSCPTKRQVVSCSDSEEVITKPLKKGKKKIPSPKSIKKTTKKNVSESMKSPTKQESSKASSDSENESATLPSKVKARKSLDIVNVSAKTDEIESFSEDEPLVNISRQKLNKMERKPTHEKRLVESEEDSSKKTDSSSDSEDEPIVKLVKKSSNEVTNSKCNSIKKSEMDPLSNFSKQKSNKTASNEISSNESEEDTQKSKPIKMYFSSDSEDEPIVQLAKKSSKKVKINKDKLAKKSLEAVNRSSNENSCESEDEPLAKFSKQILNETECKPVASEMSSIESEEEIPKSKPKKIYSASDSEDEPIMKLAQKSSKNIKTVNGKSVKKSTKSKKLDLSDSDEEPLGKKISTSLDKSLNKSSLSKDSSSSSIDENEEQSPKKDMQSKKEKLSNSVKDKKRPSASENKIEHLKKYVRAAGIRVQNYTKLFKDCKSMKAKSEKLSDLLEKHGLKGKPTLEKCKKLKKKIETKKEVAELDLSNILKTEGRRPKRSVCADTTNHKEQVEEAPTPVKRFSRLKDIVDSEGSD